MQNQNPNPPFPPQYQQGYYQDEPKPKGMHTLNWLLLQSILTIVLSGFLSLVCAGINELAFNRLNDHLLLSEDYNSMVSSMAYCFALFALSIFSIMLIEIAYRKKINYLQYSLIGCAMCVFYLLLLSFTEFIDFWGAYAIVTAMTVGLISLYIKAIISKNKAVWQIAGILIAEYAIIAILINMGTLALLVGSLLLFIIIAMAMYFTIKLKIIDGELTFNK